MGEKLNLKGLDWLFLILLIIGGLNWGLVGISRFNLVARIFGDGTALSNIIYILVGISALYFLVRLLMGSESTAEE